MLRMEMIPFSLEHQLRCLNRQLQASWQGDTEHLLLIYTFFIQSVQNFSSFKGCQGRPVDYGTRLELMCKRQRCL